MKKLLGGLFGGILIACGVLWILYIGLGPGLSELLGDKAALGHYILGIAYILMGIGFVAVGTKSKAKKPQPVAEPAPEVGEIPDLAKLFNQDVTDVKEEPKAVEEAPKIKESEEELPQEGESMENRVEFEINRQYKGSSGHKKYCLSTLVTDCRQNDEWLHLKNDESQNCDVEVFYALDVEKGLHVMFVPAGEDWPKRFDSEQKTPWRIVAKCGVQKWSAGVTPISGPDYHAGLDVVDPRFIATVTASLIAGKDVDFLIRSGAGGFSVMGTINAVERFRFTTMFCGLLTSQWNEYLEIGQLDRIHVAVARIQMDAASRNFEASKEFYDRIYDLVLILCKRDPRESIVAYDDWNNPDVAAKNRKPAIRTYTERDVDNSADYKDIRLPLDDEEDQYDYEDPEFADEESEFVSPDEEEHVEEKTEESDEFEEPAEKHEEDKEDATDLI